MPDGAAIFETIGAWEDFSTPSRDLRLLIAIDVVRGFPDRVARRPERYAMPRGKSVADVKAELQSVLASELATRKFSYPRTRRLAMDARAQGRGRPRGRSRDGVQPERLRRAALGRAGQERRGRDLQAVRAGGAAREDDEVPRLVPRAAPAAARLSVLLNGRVLRHSGARRRREPESTNMDCTPIFWIPDRRFAASGMTGEYRSEPASGFVPSSHRIVTDAAPLRSRHSRADDDGRCAVHYDRLP